MEKMKAFVRVDQKSNDVALKEVSKPNIDADEVLVEVKAFGVGVHDRYFIPSDAAYPYPIGIEGAGVIRELGENVKGFQIGDRVIFSSSFQPKGGSWTQYVAVSSESITHLPDKMNFTEGSTIPVAGKTALESMHALDLKEGDKLFIAGASGAIGTLVIQLAKQKGIRVVSSASSKNQEYMKSLGAEETVDYTRPTWKDEVKQWMPGGVDAALAIQPNTAKDSMDVVKDGGIVITVSGNDGEADRDITVKQFKHQLRFQEAIESLLNDISANKINITIEHVYPFEKAVDALEKTETRHAKGKLSVLVGE